MMGYREEYGPLLESIVQEGDVIAMRYFRAVEMRVERKGDGSAVTQADRGVEEMARAKVAASGLALDVLGEEMGGQDMEAANAAGRARLIIDPIDGTEEFSRGIPTFGTLLGIEHQGEIVAGMVSAPALGTRWCAYRGEGAFRNGQKIQVSSVAKLSDSMIFTTGTGSEKRRRGPRHASPPGRRGAKQPRAGRLLATHAGGGRRDRSGGGLDFHAVGPGAAGFDRGRSGRKIHQPAGQANDLRRPTSSAPTEKSTTRFCNY